MSEAWGALCQGLSRGREHLGVRRLLTFGLAWLVAAVVATTVAWQGVGLVGDQVTDDRPATLTASDVDAALAAGAEGTTTDPTASSVPGAPSTTGPATTAAPADSGSPPETRSYALTGGSAALRFSPEGVSVVFATPNPGYSVRSDSTDGGGWRVEFDGDAGRSRVEGWWDGGPQDRVDDDGSDDGDDDDGSGGSGDDGPGG